jgi:uncharacterized membrane protein YoaT (DUF817 family)
MCLGLMLIGFFVLVYNLSAFFGQFSSYTSHIYLWLVNVIKQTEDSHYELEMKLVIVKRRKMIGAING